jgi:hypothetical protein
MSIEMFRPPAPRSIDAMLRKEVEILEALGRQDSVREDPALRRRLEQAVKATFCPTCAESQADGVPCANAGKPCDQCVRSLESVRLIRSEIQEAVERRDAGLREKLASWEKDLP